MGLEIIVLLVDVSRLKLTLDLAWNTLYQGLEKRTLRNTRPVQDSRLKVLFDIDAEAELCFDDSFTSKTKSSFKNSSGSYTIIYCVKGNLLINSSWTGKTEVIKIINGKKELIKNKYEKNIYSYEINEISKNIFLTR